MILEVRPGEGGDDAVHFARQLFRALLAYSRRKGLVVTSTHDTTRTLQAVFSGSTAVLSPYTGTHRIQRVPDNDPRGRRHTSTATVALVDSDDKEKVAISGEDCNLEVYRGSGNGGQNRNKTSTAVRLRHKLTGIVVESEDSRSQWENRQRAMAKLTRILNDQHEVEVAQKITVVRNQQIATGERSVKEFTWNDQRSEVIDHSTGKRWRLADALKGNL
jgi:peptide chain release factor 1